MRRIIFNIATMLIVCATCVGCIEDGFTTSGNDVLDFSIDTLTFDTIFTDLGTPTAKFTVHNRHKKMLNISSIRIKGESSAKFYLNVDGMKGDLFNNVEIRGEDSIYIFVQALIDPTGSNDPVKFKDKIEFITNGIEQEVVLTAWAQDVNRIHGGTISTDTKFSADKPYIVFDTLTIDAGATLTLEPGTSLMFHDKGALKVDGTLIAKGTFGKTINLRGDRLDRVLPDVTYDMMSGQWGGIIFTRHSTGNEMQYVYMRGSSSGITIDSCDTSQRKLHIFNSILHNSSGSVLSAKHAWIEAEGSEFSDAGSAILDITGGKLKMVNCTFANYYLFGAISSPILTFSYLLPKEKTDLPLMEAQIDNCIVYGNASDINVGDLTGSAVYLRNCLLKSSGSDDSNFISCIWGGDPKFYTNRSEYVFDYRLKDESDAIAKGNSEYLPDVARVDMLGNERIYEAGLDLGAYRYIPQPKDNENEKQGLRKQ